MAWFELPSALSRLQTSTWPLKFVEGAILFCIIGFWQLSLQGWNQETQSWFLFSVFSYPISWITIQILRVSFSMGASVYRPLLFGRHARPVPFFDNLLTRIIDQFINWHENLLNSIWVIQPKSPVTIEQNITENTFNLHNSGTANLNGVQVGNNSGNARIVTVITEQNR